MDNQRILGSFPHKIRDSFISVSCQMARLRITILFQRQDRFGDEEFGNERSSLMDDDQRRFVHYFRTDGVLFMFYSTGQE